ncbi:MAG: hypothetical protein FJ255_05075 [Phycisphaerae bacterium]|nr:hypothetical protein [Phycisphaerae bacterium]
MAWRDWLNDDGIQGAIARWAHSQWLTRALAGERGYPRIPTRRVADGGWSEFMSTPEGRRFAENWWASTLAQVDD